MTLTFESGEVKENPSEEEIRQRIESEEYVILAINDLTYIQCRRFGPAYEVEFQESSVDRHFAATECPDAARVATLFVKYLRRDTSWRSEVQWEKVDL